MPKRGRASMKRQVQVALDAKLRIGESKHAAKQDGTAQDGIFAWETYRAYLRHGCYFATWAKDQHGCRSLEEAKPFVGEWISQRVQEGKSAYTVKMELSALAKVYGCSAESFGVTTPQRHRKDITRSRGDAVRDKGYSHEHNAAYEHFAAGTGLRAGEMRALRGTHLVQDSHGDYYIHVQSGSKGGRHRFAPIVGPHVPEIVARMQAAGKGKVWDKIPSHADTHALRAQYAATVYKAHARPLSVCQASRFFDKDKYNGPGRGRGGYTSAVYHCRSDLRGVWYDKAALLAASRALGHNRISVVAGHYLHSMGDSL